LERKNQIISAALAKLPSKYALLLELQYYQKLSYKEIADTLNLSVSAVDSRLVRAKKKLKKIISQDFPNAVS
jgi:RNA polymerase sigma-70 factor (ECF subfamily)